MRGISVGSSVAHDGSGGGVRRGMPASRNSFSMSDDQNSNTSKRVPGAYGGQTGRRVVGSSATARCSWLTRIGDLPGMYHVSMVCGQNAFGKSPLAAQTATRATPGGGTGGDTGAAGRARLSASAMRKNSGAAASTPTNAGLP